MHHHLHERERGSTAPVMLDHHGRHHGETGSSILPPSAIEQLLAPLKSRIPAAWLGTSGYLVAGVALGLVLIVALSLSRGAEPLPVTSAGTVTNDVVHLHAKDIGDTCWGGASTDLPARLTVQVDIGTDGKVRSVVANGPRDLGVMKSCVEMHVKNWEFLPQAQPFHESLPFEVDRR